MTDYSVGNIPPQVLWTLVRGDSSSFRVYVTDDVRQPLTISEWQIDMDIRRNGSLVMSLSPEPTADDSAGEFTVFITPQESEVLESDDVFDVQLSDDNRVWTVIQGSINVIEDITGPPSAGS
jgi:hypothetical protein